MTASELEILNNAIEELAKQMTSFKEDNGKALGKIYDRLTTIETQMKEREWKCEKHDKILENHEQRIQLVEKEVATLHDVPEKLWHISMSNAKLSGMIAAAGGVGGLVASLIVKIIGG